LLLKWVNIKLAPALNLWFGMLTNKADQWITSNPIKVNDAAKSPGSIKEDAED
jgi:hypothetical protein